MQNLRSESCEQWSLEKTGTAEMVLIKRRVLEIPNFLQIEPPNKIRKMRTQL
jgi:hypothetical protein